MAFGEHDIASLLGYSVALVYEPDLAAADSFHSRWSES